MKHSGQSVADPVTADEAEALFAPLKSFRHLAVAVSGGSDSVALMWLLCRWQKQLETPVALSILSVDHGLREGSFAETGQVRLWAGALGLEHHVLCWRGVKPQGGVQARAREARYRLMTAWCRVHRAGALVVAHHLDDQAETVLMRLMKGSGIDGLCGMRRSSWREGVQLVRPLLDIPKARLVATLRSAGQGWLEDPSNRDMKYERVRLRHSLENPADEGLDAAQLGKSARSLSRIRDVLDGLVHDLAERAGVISPGGFVHFDADLMQAADALIALRLLRRALMAVGGGSHPPARAKTRRLFDHMLRPDGAGATLAGCAVFRRAGRIWITREMRGGGPGGIELAPGCESVWDNRFIVRLAENSAGPCRVQMLGGQGWRRLKELCPDLEALPAAAGRSLVSFWRGAALEAVPFAGYFSAGTQSETAHFSADFFQKRLIVLTC